MLPSRNEDKRRILIFLALVLKKLDKLTYPVWLAGMRDARAAIAAGSPIVAFSLFVFWPRAAA